MSKAQYAILRFQKYKGPTVSRIEAHNERTKDVYASNPDIHTDLSKYNFHIVSPQEKYRTMSDRMIQEAGCRVRKDSVTVVEALITASPDFFTDKKPGEIKVFFDYAMKFMSTKQNQETFLSAVVHMDEKTPHMHLCFVPLTSDHRLSAKEVIGNKKKLTQWQNDFWKHMVKKYPDFERGESASETGRTHIPPRLFKQAAHLTHQKEKLVQLLSELTPLNAKKKAVEITAILEDYIPGVEELMTKMKKANRAAKELRGELSQVKKELDGSKASVLRHLELEQKVLKLDALQDMVDGLQQTLDKIPPGVLAEYYKSQTERKDTVNRD